MCTITSFKKTKLPTSVYVVRVYKDGQIMSPWFKFYWQFAVKMIAVDFNIIKHLWNVLMSKFNSQRVFSVGGGFFHSFISVEDARKHLEMIKNDGMWNEEADEELCIYRAQPAGLQYRGTTTNYTVEYSLLGFENVPYMAECIISRKLMLVELIQ